MSGWDLGTGSKVKFTKFPEGITRIRVLDSEPHNRWTHYQTQWKRSINCPGRDCPICEIRRQQKANKQPYTQNVSMRSALNIYNYETNRVEVMEQGKEFMEDLKAVMQDLLAQGHPLYDAIITVRRRGTGKDDTKYRIDVKEIVPPGEAEKELFTDLTDFRTYFKQHTSEQVLRIINGENWNDVMKIDDGEDEQIELK